MEEGHFETLVRHTTEVVAVVKASGDIAWVSPSVQSVLGYDPSEVQGRTSLSFVHPDDAELVAREMAETVAGKPRLERPILVRSLHRRGHWVVLEVMATNLLADRNVQGIVVTARDVTERVRVERALASSEAWFRALVQDSTDAIFVLDRDGDCTYASPSAERLFGWPVEDYVGRTLTRGMSGTRVALERWFTRVRDEPGYHPPEALELLHRDGSVVHAEVVATNLIDDPSVEGVVVVARDVSERRAAEQQLRLQARILEDVPAAVLSTDLAGTVTSWNPYAEQLFGWTAGEALGRSIAATVLTPSSFPDLTEVLEEVAAVGRVERELVARHRDGHEVPVHTILSAVHDGDGNVVGLLGTGVDLTARNQFERELAARTAQQAAVAELGVRALAGADPLDILQQAVDLAASTLGVMYAHALELDEEGTKGTVKVTFGYPPEASAGLIARATPGTWLGSVLATREPACFESLDAHPGLTNSTLLRRAGVRSGATALIEGRERPLGTLSVFSTEPRRFETDDLDFLSSLCDVVAAAIDRSRVADEMRRQALHDALTGLPNRMLLLDRLGHALERARRRGDEEVALLFIDLDRFKLVNDTFGHSAGDSLLVQTARRLEQSVRAGDTVARFGGDEFAILCEDLVAEGDATYVAKRIADGLGRPMAVGGREVYLTASIGIAVGGGGSDPETLLRDADVAMYRAKERGRSRWEVFDRAMRERSVQRLEIEHALRRALADDELRVEYQPLVRIDSGAVVAIEALARWDHAERGAVPPAEFIPVAEESGLIGQVGALVLGDACSNAARWRASHPDLSVAVNLSLDQLADPGLTETVAGKLAEYGLPPGALTVEITERVLVDDREVILATLQQLRSVGVRISLDDFGTGYSSLGYLTRFPIDSVKVDRSFVSGLGVDATSSAIAAAVVNIAHALGITAVAEGVEHERQAAELRKLGCDVGQGRYWSPPLGARDLEVWLASH